MTKLQRVIQYLATALAIFLAVMIIGGILGAVGLLGNLFSRDGAAGDMKTYPVASGIRNLKIQINAADLYIKEADTFSVESNLKHLNVREKGSTLFIEETGKLGGTYTDAVLTVYIPSGMILDNTDLTTGAGRLTIERLSCCTLDFELGAGDISIASLIATRSADIEGGAGRITISGGALTDLELEMGVGQLNLTSALTGDCQLDLGIGESNITLLGSKEDYRLELEKGLGSISVDGKSVTDYRSNGTNRVEINGGIGAINVEFKEQQ